MKFKQFFLSVSLIYTSMKHLKRFIDIIKEGLQSEEPEVEVLRDIGLEIEDIGFRVSVDEIPQFRGGESKIKVRIDQFRGYLHTFDIKEIKNVLLRIQDYMTDCGYRVEIYVPEKFHSNRCQRIRIFNDNIIEYEDADYDSPIDYPVTWCEVLISKEGWLKKPKKI